MTSKPSERISRRDHRVDFLRGLALAMIFINHVPGNLYASFTTSNFGFSDAAEIFVLLAGFASANAYFTRFSRGETWDASLGALKRALVLYMSHILMTVMALALFCTAAIFFARPGYVHDMIYNMGLTPLFKDTASGLVGMVLLGHQLGYFNILPMYMFFLGVLPVMMWLARVSLKLLFAVSLALWLAAGWYGLNIPNYPIPGGWFFNPFAWQLLFVMGFIAGQWWRDGRLPAFDPRLFWLSVAYLVFSCAWIKLGYSAWKPAQTLIPQHLWNFDKTYLALPRILHILALSYVVMISPFGEWLRRIPASNPLTVMGRHSLPVFCTGSLFATAGAILRYEWGGGVFRDTVIILTGFTIPMLVAYSLDAGRSVPRTRTAQATT
ncbi:OpgC family protein [Taklimakanibacter deserti]|uniref:OpgC family protein n=1 Tax=Taklimakanibacter deserti TaxID=2267839 RepID=UPI0013C4BBE9